MGSGGDTSIGPSKKCDTKKSNETCANTEKNWKFHFMKNFGKKHSLHIWERAASENAPLLSWARNCQIDKTSHTFWSQGKWSHVFMSALVRFFFPQQNSKNSKRKRTRIQKPCQNKTTIGPKNVFFAPAPILENQRIYAFRKNSAILE